MRITKDLANNIATKLAEKKKKEVDAAEKEYLQFVYDSYLAETPKSILSEFKKNPEWLYTTRSVKLDGFGFRWEYASMPKPVIANKGSDAVLTLSKELSGEIMTLKMKFTKLNDEWRKLKLDCENALISLHTSKKVEEFLPEAKKYLPDGVCNQIVPNYQTLRDKLK